MLTPFSIGRQQISGRQTGKQGWDYNHLYDLYYQAGVPLERQRVASPFISQALPSLKLYRTIDPDTWGKMISRVNGVNFTGIYGGTTAMGWQSISLPEGLTWAEYMKFLLCTLPEETRQNYLNKLSTSMEFWRKKGGCLAEETIAKLAPDGNPDQTVGRNHQLQNRQETRAHGISRRREHPRVQGTPPPSSGCASVFLRTTTRVNTWASP